MFGQVVTAICRQNGRISGVNLGDGTRIEAPVV
jgi:glycine/D-amino acid oxidase-like deaminating enzyme